MKNIINILIIDDDAIVLKSCLKIFRKQSSYVIDTASSGTEGLQQAQKKKYDIVITDLKMPQLGGMEVLKTLRTDQPDVTVIIFTGYATVDTARQALRLGAFDYVPKPFKPDELREVVANAVMAREDDPNAKMLDLMAIVSHELKSPLSVVHTTAETLYRGYFGNLPPEQHKTIEAILRNCQYLEDIIRNYLDLSKMELDELDSFKKEIDLLQDVIKPVLDIPEHRDNTQDITIATDFMVSSTVYGDPNLLRIVMTNLVNNAIKYGRNGTTMSVSLRENNNAYEIAVYNEGVGISKDDIEHKLFKKFVRLRQRSTGGIKGSGLGLYICKTIVAKHGGTIRVESEEGQWVRFIVSLPKK